MPDPIRNLGPASTHHRDSPRGLPGTPTLFGPYVIDHADFAHDGDTKELWTPQVGDVLLHAWIDSPTEVALSGAHGTVQFGTSGHANFLGALMTTNWEEPWVFDSAAPIQALYTANGDSSQTSGHWEVYALVARPASP